MIYTKEKAEEILKTTMAERAKKIPDVYSVINQGRFIDAVLNDLENVNDQSQFINFCERQIVAVECAAMLGIAVGAVL